MSLRIAITSNLPQVARLFKALRQMGANPQPLLRDIAFLGESSTRERFRSQTGPDGQRWKPSLRAQLTGGKTLTKDGHLGDSITSTADQHAAEWGTNRIYAAIHQFGGTIKPKSGKLLAFRGHVAKSVTIPARPYLGLSDADQNELVERTLDWLRTSGGLK